MPGGNKFLVEKRQDLFCASRCVLRDWRQRVPDAEHR
jgi:hypothetical protein